MTPGILFVIALRTASIAQATTERSSLIKVGKKLVVPKRRCASAIVRMVATLGASLNSTPPPPFT